MSALIYRAFLAPTHNLLTRSITIFGTCRQDDCPARARVHVSSVLIWPACQHPQTFVIGLGFQYPSPESLVSSSAVSSNFPQLWPLLRCQLPARVYPQPALYQCLSFAQGHRSSCELFVLVIRLNLLCLTVQLHCPQCPVTVFVTSADSLQLACNTPCNFSDHRT